MNKKQAVLTGIALTLLFTGIALATSTTLSASSDVIIYAFDQNPAGLDESNEWVTFHNPSNKSVNISGWTLSSRCWGGTNTAIPKNTTIHPKKYSQGFK